MRTLARSSNDKPVLTPADDVCSAAIGANVATGTKVGRGVDIVTFPDPDGTITPIPGDG
jgi:hypothetical protein